MGFPQDRAVELERLASERGLAVATLIRTITLAHLRDLKSNVPPITTTRSGAV